MNTEEMLHEVNNRVADVFIQHLLPLAVARHTKFKGTCQCNYCNEKRVATSNIANMRIPIGCPRLQSIDDFEVGELKQYRRDVIRTFYRERLKELVDE